MLRLFVPEYVKGDEIYKVLWYKKASLTAVTIGGAVGIVLAKLFALPALKNHLDQSNLAQSVSTMFFDKTAYWIVILLTIFALEVLLSNGVEASIAKRLTKVGSSKRISSAQLIGPTHNFKLVSILGFIAMYIGLSLVLPWIM